MPSNVVVVTVPASRKVVEVVAPGSTRLVKVVTPGPQGPRGPSGAAGSGVEFVQASPASTWVIPRPEDMARKPAVTLYSNEGALIESDVEISASFVTVTFAAPLSGSAILT
jgi:hypothetical protein